MREEARGRQSARVHVKSPRTGDFAGFLTTPLALVLLFALFYSILHIFTWAMPRYRLPVDAVLLPFAALAVYDLARRARGLAQVLRGQVRGARRIFRGSNDRQGARDDLFSAMLLPRIVAAPSCSLEERAESHGIPPFLLSIAIDLKRQTRKPRLKFRIFSGDCTINDACCLELRQGGVGKTCWLSCAGRNVMWYNLQTAQDYLEDRPRQTGGWEQTMNRKREHVIARWLIGVLIFISLAPQPVGATSPEPALAKQGATYLPLLQKPAAAVDVAWPMAGANPQRTSWTAANISGGLSLDWYRTITPYIPPRFQIIAANNTLYISSAKGLYALNATSGAQNWVFATELPLGNSPTHASIGGENILFVGGHDHRLYAIKDNGSTYRLKWTFEMGINSSLDPGEIPSGYDTNPLVINNTVYMGNRNGYVYAVNATTGGFVWKYKTNGRINFSIAASSDNSTVYAVSNDTYAYALNASNGSLVWKSVKLPTGDGFQSWWPVVHVAGNTLIISSSRAYRVDTGPYNGGGSNGDAGYTPNVSSIPANRRATMTNGIQVFQFLTVSTGLLFHQSC